MDSLALLQCLYPALSTTTLRQLSLIVLSLLTMTGRVTMTGIARWSGDGASYRTIQRFFATLLPWPHIFWLFFCQHHLQPDEVYILASDEVVVTKAGKQTFGLDRFFSGVLQKVVPGLRSLAWHSLAPKPAVPFRYASSKLCAPRYPITIDQWRSVYRLVQQALQAEAAQQS